MHRCRRDGFVRQLLHELDISIEKIIKGQILRRLPANLRENQVLQLASELGHFKKDELDRLPVRIGVFVTLELGPDDRLNRQLLCQFPRQRRAKLLVRFRLAARKFPLPGVGFRLPSSGK